MDKLDSFPIGKERKDTLEQSRKKIDRFKKTGKDEILLQRRYSWVNSSVDGPDEIDGQPFRNSFRDILPKQERSLKDYIEKVLAKRKGEAIGIEFGGIGSRLFSDFTPGFFAKSVGVSLVDHREPEKLAIIQKGDEKINHELLEGDIFTDETHDRLNKLLRGKKIDLIIERMASGLEFVPLEPYRVSKILQIWYKLLREGGIMLVQTPVEFNNLLTEWVTKIQKEYKDVIELEYQKGNNDRGDPCSAFRLRKLPGAPEELPLLNPRTVRLTPKSRW